MITIISSHIKRGLLRYITENRLTVIFFILFAFGMVFGSLSITGYSNIPLAFKWYLNLRETTFWVIFCYSLLVSILPLILCYCSGLFFYGFVPCVLLLIIQGAGYGAISGYIYNNHGLFGVAFVLLVLLPGCFFNVVLQLFGCKEAFRFSLLFCKSYYKDIMVSNPSGYLKRYHYKFLILLVFGFFVALFNCSLSFVFTGVFGF